MNKIFEGQTVIISGGLGDIGFATAIEFAAGGAAAIAICGMRSDADALPIITKLKEYNCAYKYKQVNVSDAIAIRLWIDETEEQFGVPTIIIANAATVTSAGLHDITPEQWATELNVNLNGAFYLTQYATAKLKEKKLPGKVVFVGSWAGTKVHPHIPAYSVSKAGMTMLCKCMALELAPHQIMVNEIAPGYVDAGLSRKIWENHPDEYQKALQKVPVKKIMSASAVAEQIVYLCNPKNIHMTGTTLLMDGGLSLLS